jgi:hypothetical protein
MSNLAFVFLFFGVFILVGALYERDKNLGYIGAMLLLTASIA